MMCTTQTMLLIFRNKNCFHVICMSVDFLLRFQDSHSLYASMRKFIIKFTDTRNYFRNEQTRKKKQNTCTHNTLPKKTSTYNTLRYTCAWYVT